MFKTLAVAALISPLGLQSMDDHLQSTTALSTQPAVIEHAVEAAEGALVDDLTWDGTDAGLYDVHHKYWHHGGHGGEGGEGGEGHYKIYNVPSYQTYYPAYVNQPYPQHQGQSFFGPCNRDSLIGAIAGGAAGGLLGSQIGKGSGQLVAVGAGVLIGALLGQEVGSRLSAGDLACAEQAGYQAHTVPVGQQISWNNPQTGNSGYVVPVRDGTHQGTGQYCREYQTVVYVGGRQESGYGTACYRPDGSWEIIN